jgi:hypothetical protein
MWKRILSLAARFWRIADDVEQNKTDIAELRQEMHRMGRVLDWLMIEFRHAREHDASEREKLVLRLENELLKFERRLPPAKSK